MKVAGLGIKLLAGLALISFIAMSGLITVLSVYLADTLESQVVKRGVTVAHFLAQNSINPILTRKHLAIDLMLREQKMHDKDLAYIFILDPRRELLSHTFPAGFPTALKGVQNPGSAVHRITPIDFGGQEILDISVPVMEGKLGDLHVGMSLQGVKRETRSILITVSGIIIILFLAAAVAMWLYVGRVAVRPIKQLGEQVALLGTGDFDAHVDVRSRDELGMLGAAFNEMRRRLNEYYEQMADRTDELARLNEQLAQLATTDGLTGLYNHRQFYARLTEEMKRAKRYQHPLSLIIGDIDHFKQYNDSCGHVAGDKVLRIIAGLIGDSARENDLVARYGGEEFCIILPETSLSTARLVAERMRLIIEASRELSECHSPSGHAITISFGVAELDDTTDNPKGFVRIADDMLYRAKQKGRNRVEC